MIGLVLAAGAGRRLRPFTDQMPKTLLPLNETTTVLDTILANLAEAGLDSAVLVVGYAAEAVQARLEDLQARHGLALTLVHNDHAEDRNNCYSLWCARDVLADGVILVNGDTVHPASVEHGLRRVGAGATVTLALDTAKVLADEEMKVQLRPDGRLLRITKQMDPLAADGEYIGVARIDPAGSGHLVEALRETWQRDDSLYYEDGFQTFADAGGTVVTSPIGEVDWVEVDNLDDLERARALVCPS